MVAAAGEAMASDEAEIEAVVRATTERSERGASERGGEWEGVEVGRAARYMRELIKKQVNSNHLARVGSITDSSVLRRKGRLKEQDADHRVHRSICTRRHDRGSFHQVRGVDR